MELLTNVFQSLFTALVSANWIDFLGSFREIAGIILDSLKKYFNVEGNGEVETPSI